MRASIVARALRDKYVELCLLAALTVGLIAVIEANVPNSPRLTFTAGYRDPLDLLPPYLDWAAQAGPRSLSAYQLLILATGGLAFLLLAISFGSAVKANVAEAAIPRKASGPVTPLAMEELRRVLRRKTERRGSVMEPVAGGLLVTSLLWLGAVVFASKVDAPLTRPFLPPPMLVAQNLERFGPEFFPALLRSCWHLLQGVIWGTLLGLLLGFLLSTIRRLHDWTAWHIAVISALPPFLLAEVFRQLVRAPWLPFVGVSGEVAFKLAIAMSAWAVMWPVLTATSHALTTTDEEFRSSITLLGARRRLDRWLHLEIPLVVPPVLKNLRVGIVIGLIVLLYAESYGAPRELPTLGYWFSETTNNYKLQTLAALLVFTSGLVILFEGGLKLLESALVHRSFRLERFGSGYESQTATAEERRFFLEPFEQARARRFPEPVWTTINWTDRGVECAFRARGVRVQYGAVLALEIPSDHEVNSRKGEFLSIIGRSGSGKSTLVKLLLGFVERGSLERMDNTSVLELAGRPVAGELKGNRRLAELSHLVSYVSQRALLFPNKRVVDNLLFGVVRQQRWASRTLVRTPSNCIARFYKDYLTWLLGDIASRDWRREWLVAGGGRALTTPLGYLLLFIGLSDKMKSYPVELSGGEAQRVHLVRWLVLARPFLIMDEAFSALDQPLKGMMRDAIHRLAKALGTTVLNVSHDRADVLQISDRVLFIDQQQVVVSATPRALYFAPPSRQLAVFLGHTNLFEVELSASGEVYAFKDAYRIVDFSLPYTLRPTIIQEVGNQVGRPVYNGRRALLFIPATDVNVEALASEDASAGDAHLDEFEVEAVRFTGGQCDIRLQRNGRTSAPLRLEAIVQDDELTAKLGSYYQGPDQLIGRRVQVSIARGIILNEVTL